MPSNHEDRCWAICLQLFASAHVKQTLNCGLPQASPYIEHYDYARQICLELLSRATRLQIMRLAVGPHASNYSRAHMQLVLQLSTLAEVTWQHPAPSSTTHCSQIQLFLNVRFF